MELSLGVCFDPTNEQLINGFLRKKQRGENLPNYYIKECRVYDKEPWLIFNKDIQQIHYVFVRLIKKSEKMVQRTAGNGTWKGENNVEVKDEQGRAIGSKKLLTFQHDCVDNGRWVMHEYSINKNDSLVVCAIRNRELDNVEQVSVVLDFDGVFGARNQWSIEGVENGVTENVQVAGTSSSNLSITAWEAHEDPILPLGNDFDSIFSECTPLDEIGTSLEEYHCSANTFNGSSGSNLCGIEWEGQGNPIWQLANSATCFLGECTPMSAIGSSSEEAHPIDTFNGNNAEQGSLLMDFEGVLGVQETGNQQFAGEVAGTSGSNLSITAWEVHGDPILPLGDATTDSIFSECTPINAIGTYLEEAYCPANTFNVYNGELAGTLGLNLCGIEWEGQDNPILQMANGATCFFGECIGSSSEVEHFADTLNGGNIQQGSLAMDFEGVLGVQETGHQHFWTEENGIENFEFPSLQHPENIQVNPGELAGTSALNLCSTTWQVYGDPILPIGSANTFDVYPGELAGTSGSNLCCLELEANGDPILPLGNVADSVFSECTTISATGTSFEEAQHPTNCFNELGVQASIPEREEETNHTRSVSTRPIALVEGSLIGQGAGYKWETVVGFDVSSDYRQMSAEASCPNKRRRLGSCVSSYKRWGLSSNV